MSLKRQLTGRMRLYMCRLYWRLEDLHQVFTTVFRSRRFMCQSLSIKFGRIEWNVSCLFAGLRDLLLTLGVLLSLLPFDSAGTEGRAVYRVLSEGSILRRLQLTLQEMRYIVRIVSRWRLDRMRDMSGWISPQERSMCTGIMQEWTSDWPWAMPRGPRWIQERDEIPRSTISLRLVRSSCSRYMALCPTTKTAHAGSHSGFRGSDGR